MYKYGMMLNKFLPRSNYPPCHCIQIVVLEPNMIIIVVMPL